MTSGQSRSDRRPGKPQLPSTNGIISHDTAWAIAVGPLDADGCRAAEIRAATRLVRQAQADDTWQLWFLGALRPAEALHVKQVHLTLSPSAAWLDAFRLIRNQRSVSG